MNYIACITLNQDSFGSVLYHLNLGVLCYPNPADTVSMLHTIEKRRPIMVIVDTASVSPEMAKEHFVALKKMEPSSFKIIATAGDDPDIEGVTYVADVTKLKEI